MVKKKREKTDSEWRLHPRLRRSLLSNRGFLAKQPFSFNTQQRISGKTKRGNGNLCENRQQKKNGDREKTKECQDRRNKTDSKDGFDALRLSDSTEARFTAWMWVKCTHMYTRYAVKQVLRFLGMLGEVSSGWLAVNGVSGQRPNEFPSLSLSLSPDLSPTARMKVRSPFRQQTSNLLSSALLTPPLLTPPLLSIQFLQLLMKSNLK